MDRVSLEEQLIVLPLLDTRQVVRSHDQGKLMLRILLMEIYHCVNGKGRLGEGKLNIRSPEPGIVIDRQLNHVQAVKVIGQCSPVLKGVVRRDDKPYLLKVSTCSHVFCDDEMSDVDRIERTEE